MSVITGAVEGFVDEAVVRRIVTHAGGSLGTVHGRKGKGRLIHSLPGYNRAARHSPWLVLVDLDQDADCAPSARMRWLPDAADAMCLRIAVHEVEAWLMADRERMSAFLGVPQARLPGQPDAVPHPKEYLVDLAKVSRRRDVLDDMVPRPASGRAVGPGYSGRLIEFAQSVWRPEVAAGASDSLWRCIDCVQRLAS